MADDDMVAWMTSTLDAMARAAEAVASDPTPWTESVGRADADDADRAMLAFCDPRAVLARIEAERALLALHRDTVWQMERRVHGEHMGPIGIMVPNFEPIPGAYACGLCSDADEGAIGWPCQSIRLLTYGHRFDAAGYRDEWRPE